MSDDAEEKAARVRRAREVVDGADWLFKEHAATCQNEWINTAPGPHGQNAREEIHQRLRAVIDLKAILIGILNTAENDQVIRDRSRSS